MGKILATNSQKILFDFIRKDAIVMSKGRNWIVKYAEEIETVDGPKVLCPYCDILHDKNEVAVSEGYGTCPMCHKAFCFKPAE